MDDELTAFITARLDEVEAAAKAAEPGPWHWEGGYPQRISNAAAVLVAECYTNPDVPSYEAEHIALHDPDRVLREVATWRRILLEYSIAPGTDAKYGGTERETGFRLALSFALKAKALEWKDHPDWREWAPGHIQGT